MLRLLVDHESELYVSTEFNNTVSQLLLLISAFQKLADWILTC